jgi:hypothetical protein
MHAEFSLENLDGIEPFGNPRHKWVDVVKRF